MLLYGECEPLIWENGRAIATGRWEGKLYAYRVELACRAGSKRRTRWGFDGLVTLAISQVATKMDRHLLGPDLHRLC